MSPRTETSYKAERPGKAAPHVDAQDSGRTVNGGVVQLEFAFLSGETCPEPRPEPSGSAHVSNDAGVQAGVSRGHSTAGALAVRPEHDGRERPRASSDLATKPHGGAETRRTPEQSEPQVDLLERILSRQNMQRAWKRVKANRGAAGLDAMSTDAFPEFARDHWPEIRSALREGRYRPPPVRRSANVSERRGPATSPRRAYRLAYLRAYRHWLHRKRHALRRFALRRPMTALCRSKKTP